MPHTTTTTTAIMDWFVQVNLHDESNTHADKKIGKLQQQYEHTQICTQETRICYSQSLYYSLYPWWRKQEEIHNNAISTSKQ